MLLFSFRFTTLPCYFQLFFNINPLLVPSAHLTLNSHFYLQKLCLSFRFFRVISFCRTVSSSGFLLPFPQTERNFRLINLSPGEWMSCIFSSAFSVSFVWIFAFCFTFSFSGFCFLGRLWDLRFTLFLVFFVYRKCHWSLPLLGSDVRISIKLLFFFSFLQISGFSRFLKTSNGF